LDFLLTDPNEIDQDDLVGRQQRRGRPVRGPKNIIEGISNKGRRRREIDQEEAELKKKLKPKIDELEEEILRLQKIR
jgi:hypothetical protein